MDDGLTLMCVNSRNLQLVPPTDAQAALGSASLLLPHLGSDPLLSVFEPRAARPGCWVPGDCLERDCWWIAEGLVWR